MKIKKRHKKLQNAFKTKKNSEIVRIYHFFDGIAKPNEGRIKSLVLTAPHCQKLRYFELLFYVLRAKLAMGDDRASRKSKFKEGLGFIVENLKALGNDEAADLLMKEYFGFLLNLQFFGEVLSARLKF